MTSEEEIRQPSLWRMVVTGSCIGRVTNCVCSECWLYNIFDQSECYPTDILDGSPSALAIGCHGWLVLAYKRFNEKFELGKLEISLFNMASKEKIQLPELNLIKTIKSGDSFFLTAPPNTSACLFILFSPIRSSFFVWRFAKKNWLRIRYVSRIILSQLKVCNQKIYAIVDSRYFARCDFIDDAFTITIIGPMPPYTIRGYGNVEIDDRALVGKELIRIEDDGVPFNDEDELDDFKGCDTPKEVWDVLNNLIINQYLIECEDDFFWIQIPKAVDSNHEIEGIYVYKFDKENTKWVLVNDIGKEWVFILNQDHSFSYSSTNSSVKEGNCIYFLDFNSSICTYDVGEDSMAISIPAVKPEWYDRRVRHMGVFLF